MQLTDPAKGGHPIVESKRSAVLLDKQPLWLEAVERVLGWVDVVVAGKATSPAVALDLVAKHQPDLVVSGIEMSADEMNGIEFLRRALEQVPRPKGIILSDHTEPQWIEQALDAGAAAYVLKSAHPDDLASAVRQTFELSIYFSSARRVPPPALAPAPLFDAAAADLTQREREILILVAEGHSNAKLAKMLWVTEQTVKFHLSNIYRKLEVANRTEAAWWARQHGLLGERAAPNDSDASDWAAAASG